MNEDQVVALEEDTSDLGAATERTLGVWDPILKENHETPESFTM